MKNPPTAGENDVNLRWANIVESQETKICPRGSKHCLFASACFGTVVRILLSKLVLREYCFIIISTFCFGTTNKEPLVTLYLSVRHF